MFTASFYNIQSYILYCILDSCINLRDSVCICIHTYSCAHILKNKILFFYLTFKKLNENEGYSSMKITVMVIYEIQESRI